MSLDEGYVKIENNNYDIDSLFNFQANFDQLKFVIMALATAQKKSNDRIAKLENGGVAIVEEDEENDMENSDLDKTPGKSPMKNSMISGDNMSNDMLVVICSFLFF